VHRHKPIQQLHHTQVCNYCFTVAQSVITAVPSAAVNVIQNTGISKA